MHFCDVDKMLQVSSYTANLAAVLTIENPVKLVRGIEDLYNQTTIKFGAKRGGSTFLYFKVFFIVKA